MTTRLLELRIDRIDLVKRGANPEAHVRLVKYDDKGERMGTSPDVTALEKQANNAEARAAKAEDALAAIQKDHDKERSELAKQLDETAKSVERLETQIAVDAAIAKASKLPNLGTEDEVAEILRVAKSGMGDGYEAFEKKLDDWNTKLGAAFTEIGVSGTDEGDTPFAKLEKMAETYQEAHPDITWEVALDTVMRTADGVELYKQHREG